MRIIARLPDARMQITVFENDGRFPVQFERGGLSQVYRFRKGERLSNVGHLRAYVDEHFRSEVMRQFLAMEEIRSAVARRISPPPEDTNVLPDII